MFGVSAPVLGVFEIEPAARRPCIPVVAVVRQTPCILQHASHVHQAPGHDRGVALRELVVEAGTVVAIARAESGLSDPAAIGLRWDHVARMRQRIGHVHRHMLDPVLVAGDYDATGLGVEDGLALVVQQPGHRIEPFDHKPTDLGLLAQPDRRADDENVGRLHLAPQIGPVVMLPAMLAHDPARAQLRYTRSTRPPRVPLAQHGPPDHGPPAPSTHPKREGIQYFRADCGDRSMQSHLSSLYHTL